MFYAIRKWLLNWFNPKANQPVITIAAKDPKKMTVLTWEILMYEKDIH